MTTLISTEKLLRDQSPRDMSARAALVDYLIESGRDDEAELVRTIFEPKTKSDQFATDLVSRDGVDVLDLPRLASNNRYQIYPYRYGVSYSRIDKDGRYRLAGWANSRRGRIWLFEPCSCGHAPCVCDEADAKAYKLIKEHEGDLYDDEKGPEFFNTEENLIDDLIREFDLSRDFARRLFNSNQSIIIGEDTPIHSPSI